MLARLVAIAVILTSPVLALGQAWRIGFLRK